MKIQHLFLLFALLFFVVACAPAAPTPTPALPATPTPTITVAPTNTPIPKTPTPTITPTPTLETFNGFRPIVAFESYRSNITEQCSTVNGEQLCKSYIFIGDPALPNPYSGWKVDLFCNELQQPDGEWRKIEVVRPERTSVINRPHIIQWLPDGSGIVYVREFSSNGAILSIFDLSSNSYVDIASDLPGGVDEVEVSPDSRWVAYKKWVANKTEAYVFNIKTGETYKISTADVYQMSWTDKPDTILYIENNGGQPYEVVLGQPAQPIPRPASATIMRLMRSVPDAKFNMGYQYDAVLMGTLITPDYEPYSSGMNTIKQGWFFTPDEKTLFSLIQGNINPYAQHEFIFSPDRKMILMNIVWDYKLDDATYVSYRAAYGLTPGNVLDLPDTDNQMLGFRWAPDGKYFAAYLNDSKNGCEEQKYPFRIVVVNAETNEIVGQYPLGPVPAYVGYYNGSMRGMDIIWVPQK